MVITRVKWDILSGENPSQPVNLYLRCIPEWVNLPG